MRRLLVLVMVISIMVSVGGNSIYAFEGMKAQNDASSLSGRVVETMDSGRYTYALIEKEGKKTWVAVPQMEIVVGQDISFKKGMEMVNFESKTLNRTFDKIIFSEGPVVQKAPVNEMKSMGSKGKVVIPDKKITVERASGPDAYTVAEIYRDKDSLKDKKVVIKGEVVKVTADIMNRNWIHLQDGSGDPKEGTHNIVVTSQDLPKVGDVVTVKGILYADKDFGSGYKYDVIVENARVVQ